MTQFSHGVCNLNPHFYHDLSWVNHGKSKNIPSLQGSSTTFWAIVLSLVSFPPWLGGHRWMCPLDTCAWPSEGSEMLFRPRRPSNGGHEITKRLGVHQKRDGKLYNYQYHYHIQGYIYIYWDNIN